MASYGVTIFNDSEASGTFVVYQTNPVQEKNQNIYSLAWFAKVCHTRSRVEYSWKVEYSFVWGKPGKLEPGVIFEASSFTDADPADTNKNSIAFFSDDKGYHFGETHENVARGSLGIYCSQIPNLETSVGFGMDGNAVFACNALANTNFTLTPRPQYWVRFGDYKQGQVIDLKQAPHDALELSYGPNEYDLHVSLTHANRWQRTDGSKK